MTGHQHNLDTYGSIAATTARMVDAAKDGDWDRLVALERDCRALIDTLRITDANLRPDAPYLQRKADLIRKVLADDAEIRRFTDPWMAKLAAYLGSARQQQRLHNVYGSGHDL